MASCLCTVLRRALYHYSTRSPNRPLKRRHAMHQCSQSRCASTPVSRTARSFCSKTMCHLSRTQQALEETCTSLQRTEHLSGIISEQDLRALRAACLCLNSLRIRVEARANTTERAVIDQQVQFMQTTVQPYPTEDLHTADTSPSRTSKTSIKPTVLGEEAPRLQACINAVELAIIANSIASNTVLRAVCTTGALSSSPITMMLGKELLSGICVDSESCDGYAASLFTIALFHTLFHFLFHLSIGYMAESLLASGLS